VYPTRTMTTIQTSVPKESVQTAPNWSDWFGVSPRGEAVVTNPYSTYSRETLALPEVYKGSNPYLTNVMIRIIDDEQLIPTKILLPIRQTQNETSVTWDEFHFNNTLLGPVPEEGVSRLVTQQISERRDHYVRYGLAFMIEHGFMNSPKGQMSYRMNLEQIRDAILQSLYIGVIESLLRCKTSSQLFMQCYGKSFTAVSARKRLDMEVEAFGEIQKTDYGWDMLNSRAQRTLKLNGVTPDAWVLDDGVKKYIAGVRRENWAYFLKGPKGPAMYEENQGVGDAKSLDVSANTLIFECKQFNLPNHDDPVNITSRRRTIGEYAVSFPHVDYSACQNYSSAFRDILVYDEDRDGFKKLGLMEGLNHCQRFDRDGELSFDGFESRQPFMGKDMFLSEKGHGQHKYLGQMNGGSEMDKTKSNDLPDEAIRDWTMSVVTGLDEEKQISIDLQVLKRLVAKLDAKPITESTTKQGVATMAYFDYIKHAYANNEASVRLNSDDNMLQLPLPGQDKKNAPGDKATFPFEFGNLFDSTNTVGTVLAGEQLGTALFVPYGFGSHVGLNELAKEKYKTAYPELHGEAKQALRGFNSLVQRLETVCYGNLFMSSAPFFFKNKDVRAAVFANLVHERLPPVVCKTTAKYAPEPEAEALVGMEGITDFHATFKGLMHPLKHVSDQDTKNMTAAQKANGDTIAKNAADKLFDIAKTLTQDYRKVLVKFVTNATSTPDDLEQLFEMIMSDMDDLDWYQTTILLGNNWRSFKDFKKNIGKEPSFAQSPGGTETTKMVVTQLTCSEALSDYFEGDGTYAKTGLYSYAYGDKADGMVNIGAGHDGEVVGYKKGTFGIKRKNPADPANASYHALGDENEMWKTDLFGGDDDFKNRVATCAKMFSSPLQRAVAVAFLGTPIHKEAFSRFIQTNVVFPFNVIYARPYMTYDMSTGICMKSGSESGETLVGHADFQLGDNIVQKLHMGNFTFYSKSVVYRQQNVYLAEDMFSTGYVGGDGTAFFEEQSDYENFCNGGTGRHKSIFAMLAPYSSSEYANPIDITGRYSGNLAPLNDPDVSKLHFASAQFYSWLWNWSEQSADQPSRCHFDSADATPNSLCFQGHQSMYNPSNSMFDLVVKNTGHWGDRVYPGCGKVRQGMNKLLEPVYYNNVYGGGGNMNGMLK
jgi:hypothetical protein